MSFVFSGVPVKQVENTKNGRVFFDIAQNMRIVREERFLVNFDFGEGVDLLVRIVDQHIPAPSGEDKIILRVVRYTKVPLELPLINAFVKTVDRSDTSNESVYYVAMTPDGTGHYNVDISVVLKSKVHGFNTSSLT